MSNFFHDINQPLTAISNYASAARILLLKCRSSPLSSTDEEISKIVGWLEQISAQAKVASQIAHEHPTKANSSIG
jgi:C4-dicarboxylate-specific signal transduction histidine kinase